MDKPASTGQLVVIEAGAMAALTVAHVAMFARGYSPEEAAGILGQTVLTVYLPLRALAAAVQFILRRSRAVAGVQGERQGWMACVHCDSQVL
jgi:hypothetical protein